MSDEAFHHKFGKIWADRTVPKLSESEHIKVEDWAEKIFTELLFNLINPFEKKEVYASVGLDAKWVQQEFEKYIGCARFVTNLNSLFVTFAKYKHKSKVNPLLWDKMAEIGKSKGADPAEWYATFTPMSINI